MAAVNANVKNIIVIEREVRNATLALDKVNRAYELVSGADKLMPQTVGDEQAKAALVTLATSLTERLAAVQAKLAEASAALTQPTTTPATDPTVEAEGEAQTAE